MNWPVVILISIAAWAFVFGYFGAWVATQCGRSETEGLILGVLFGGFGVLIEALLPKFPRERLKASQHRADDGIPTSFLRRSKS